MNLTSMPFSSASFALLGVAFFACSTLAADEWPQWRGPNGDSKAASSGAPLEWGPEENILWKSPVPGRGHSSPTVVGDQIFLTTADEKAKTQSVLAYDSDTGEKLWDRTLFTGGLDPRAHVRNSQASCSVACGEDRLFVTFMNEGAVWVTCLDLLGEQVWRQKVGAFVSFWGYSASPMLYEATVLVVADHSEGGYLVALDQRTGKEVWRTARPKQRNYPSPVVHRTSGREQLLLAGCDRIGSYDPQSGQPLWEAEATTEECVGTVIVDGDLAFAGGGYPKSVTVAVRTDGSGEIAWSNNVKVYVPSLLAHNGLLFATTDNGIAYCWNARDGKLLWKKRLGGVFNASPVLVGDNVVAAREDGMTFVFAATGEAYKQVAENKLGDEVYATPTFVGDRIFLRVAEGMGGERQEFLYCVKQIAEAKP